MKSRRVIYGEYALLVSLLLNSLGVELQVKSGFGISCISSVSYAMSHVFSGLSFGTWSYVIQILVLLLLIGCTRTWKAGYLLSMVLSVAFGNLLDMYAALLPTPVSMVGRVVCFGGGYVTLCFSIWMLQRCLLPILPFDEFTRDMSSFYHVAFRRFKTEFDLLCLACSVVISLVGLGHVVGIGAGTLISALFTGTAVGLIGSVMDQKWQFRVHNRRFRRLA